MDGQMEGEREAERKREREDGNKWVDQRGQGSIFRARLCPPPLYNPLQRCCATCLHQGLTQVEQRPRGNVSTDHTHTHIHSTEKQQTCEGSSLTAACFLSYSHTPSISQAPFIHSQLLPCSHISTVITLGSLICGFRTVNNNKKSIKNSHLFVR